MKRGRKLIDKIAERDKAASALEGAHHFSMERSGFELGEQVSHDAVALSV
jgi:hypothetical protein